MGKSSDGKIGTVTSILKGGANHAFDSSEVDGGFHADQKKEIVGQLTGAVVSIEEKDISSVTWVTIEEVCSGEWSIGGQDVTTDAGAPPCRRQ